ncbi:hypothetical protein [uncultured Jatrophihabitans sp.]|uniref:hypothetical protein n=1 Tax=uncultured Jatrophihabitans sp. TaxID=1610747 RepID=UPI0035C9B1A0
MDVPDLNWVALLPVLLGVIYPAIASFISREHLPSEVTAGIIALLSAVAGFVSQAAASGSFSFSRATATALLTYVIASVARSQFWKNTHTDAQLLAFPRKLPKKGQLTSHYAGVPDDDAPDGTPALVGRHEAA